VCLAPVEALIATELRQHAVTRVERAFICCEVHDFQGNIHQEKYINEMYGVKEMGLLWWERQGKTNKGKRAGRTFEETKKVASRSNERSNEWHELKAAYIHTKYYIYST
jgi:hypothetical protein